MVRVGTHLFASVTLHSGIVFIVWGNATKKCRRRFRFSTVAPIENIDCDSARLTAFDRRNRSEA